MIGDTRSLAPGDYLALAAAVLLCTAYIVYFGGLSSFPLQDLPNHLARAEIISDLLFDEGARFGGRFGIQLAPIPYLLHDLIFATLVQVFGTRAGAAIFTTFVLLSLPCALLLYMQVTGVARRARLTILVLSLFLSTDRFFLMGFFGFRLAIALIVASFAIAEWLRRRLTLPRYAVYLAVLVAGYLTHLTMPAFFLLALGVSATVRLITRTSTFTREALLVAPVASLLAVYFLFVHSAGAPAQASGFQYKWGSWSDKLFLWSFEFGRFGGWRSQILLLMLGACVLFGVWHALKPSSFKNVLVIENLLIAVAFVAVYIVLPREYPDSGYVDVRALVMVSLSLLLASLWLSHSLGGTGYGTWPVRAFAVLLVALNLGWIAQNLSPLEGWLAHYRQVAAAVPAGARVLPVATRPRVAGFSSTLHAGAVLHAGSFLVIDRQALMPYLFGRNRGDPMKYFFYVDRPYMPHEQWYTEQLKWRDAVQATYNVPGQVDWGRVACDYDWLLVTEPYDRKLIRAATRLVRQNEAASLLAVAARSCPPALRQ